VVSDRERKRGVRRGEGGEIGALYTGANGQADEKRGTIISLRKP